MITTLDMTSFQTHNGLQVFINRLEVSVILVELSKTSERQRSRVQAPIEAFHIHSIESWIEVSNLRAKENV